MQTAGSPCGPPGIHHQTLEAFRRVTRQRGGGSSGLGFKRSPRGVDLSRFCTAAVLQRVFMQLFLGRSEAVAPLEAVPPSGAV